MGEGPSSFSRTSSRRRSKKAPPESPQQPTKVSALSPSQDRIGNNNSLVVVTNAGGGGSAGGVQVAGGGKGKKKAIGARKRPWMRFDRVGQSEFFECEKSAIVRRVSIPARDLRILGSVFSHSSNILARDKAMVVNLEFIKAIVTAEEVLIFDPLRQELLPFVDQLRQQLPPIASKTQEGGIADVADNEMHISAGRHGLPVPGAAECLQCELLFEFQVLEIALEVVCTYLDSVVADLERDAYPVLDELARNVRDEIEHLSDDDEDMAQLYLSRKWIGSQLLEALLGAGASNSNLPAVPPLCRISSNQSGSIVTSNYMNDNDVEDLKKLLEAYFMQLDGTRNKILSAREYIDDTEDYVNIQLDKQRNELIQLQLILTIVSFAIAIETLTAGVFGMNIPCPLYNIDGIFGFVVWGSSGGCLLILLFVLGYARWKKLLGS